MKRLRPTVGLRLLLTLCGIAATSTGLSMILQDRALSVDLERAAEVRLQRAVGAAERVVAAHLSALVERYEAVSNTPEFRANLTVDHAPTLEFFAAQLVEQQGAGLILFSDDRDRVRARAGDAALADPATAALAGGPAALLAQDGRAFAVVGVSLADRRGPLGRLIAVEEISQETIAEWSDLCGAEVVVAEAAAPARFVLPVRRFGDLELRVVGSLDAERAAMVRARLRLLAAGGLALGVAFVASYFLAQGLVRPIREIQDATERIGRGDLGTRLVIEREDEIGEVAAAVNRMQDDLQQTLRELEQNRSRLAGAQRLARLGNWTLDPESGALDGSEEFLSIFDVGPREAPLDEAWLVARIHPEERQRFEGALQACAQRGKPFQLDHRTLAPDGTERILHTQAARVGGDGRPLRVEGIVQDVTDRKLVEDQVRYLAYHDSLTGLANRAFFRERLGLALDEARREGHGLGVLILDLDGFKVINETLGHSSGDRLLVEVADRLVQGVRAPGARSPGPAEAAMVARLGGDEFSVLMSSIQGPEDAARMARHLLRELVEPFQLDGHEVSVSGSIGVATAPSDGDDVEALLRNCDTAMYHAKEQGRNNYQFFAESMNAVVFKRLVLESRLRRAIERDELELQYQPKIELASGRVCGLEALARWRDPELGMVSPNEFIPLAEEAGLIRAIGDWALREALHQVRRWQREGMGDFRVAVNLSGHQLGVGSLVERVVESLQEAGVDPDRLELEITESALMRDEGTAIPALEMLRSMGVSVALDDFGTGYSSLSYLRRLPIDSLKIDRSFVRRIESEETDAALVGAIVSMSKILGFRVVVEGVESEGQLQVLRELGCDEVQGHFFSAATPANGVARVIAEVEQGLARKAGRSRRSAGAKRRRPPGRSRS